MKTKSTFYITINDGFGDYTYPLDVSDNNSIYGIHEKVCKSFRIKPQEGWRGNLESQSKHLPAKQPYTMESWIGVWVRPYEVETVYSVQAVGPKGIEYGNMDSFASVRLKMWEELLERWEFSDSMHGPWHPCYR